jgi:hypothetical protein
MQVARRGLLYLKTSQALSRLLQQFACLMYILNIGYGVLKSEVLGLLTVIIKASCSNVMSEQCVPVFME